MKTLIQYVIGTSALVLVLLGSLEVMDNSFLTSYAHKYELNRNYLSLSDSEKDCTKGELVWFDDEFGVCHYNGAFQQELLTDTQVSLN